MDEASTTDEEAGMWPVSNSAARPIDEADVVAFGEACAQFDGGDGGVHGGLSFGFSW